MTLLWNELHWYKFCAEASLFQSDYIPSDSPPTASPPCLASGLHQDGFFLPAWILLLHKHPDQMSQGAFHAERKPLLLLCFSACLTALLLLFLLLPSSIQLQTQCGCHAPGFLRAFFSPRKRACPVLTGPVLCCDLPVSGAEHAGGKHLWGQGPAPYYLQGTLVALLCYEVPSCCSLYLKFCTWFCKVLNRCK